MTRRIYSLETEYALMIDGSNSTASLSQIYNLLEAQIHVQHQAAKCNTVGRQTRQSPGAQLVEIKEGFFLDSGARLYYDTGHLEWSCPECDNPFDATVWSQAADRDLEEAARNSPPLLESNGHDGQIMIIKNNVDSKNDKISYGCHENYSILRRTNYGGDIFDVLKEFLPAFLITRSILAGAGKFGITSGSLYQIAPYQIAQRSDFITQIVSRDTRDNRAILNDRDEPLADHRKYRRLHLILGDSNLSNWSNLIKLGTTGLVLDVLEQSIRKDFPVLLNPIDTLHQISCDLGLRQRYKLRTGESITAIEIQRRYWYAVRDFYNHQREEKKELIIQMWDNALSALERNPYGLSDKADWAIKYRVFSNDVLPRLKTNWDEVKAWQNIISLTGHLGKPGIFEDTSKYMKNKLPKVNYEMVSDLITSQKLDWKDYLRQRKNHAALRVCDTLFHSIDRDSVLAKYWTRESMYLPFNENDIENARHNPPTGTRAQIRSRVIRSASKNRLLGMDWDKLIMKDGRVISLDDPFLSQHKQVEREFPQ